MYLCFVSCLQPPCQLWKVETPANVLEFFQRLLHPSLLIPFPNYCIPTGKMTSVKNNFCYNVLWGLLTFMQLDGGYEQMVLMGSENMKEMKKWSLFCDFDKIWHSCSCTDPLFLHLIYDVVLPTTNRLCCSFSTSFPHLDVISNYVHFPRIFEGSFPMGSDCGKVSNCVH